MSSSSSKSSEDDLCPSFLRKAGYTIGKQLSEDSIGGFSTVYSATYTNPDTKEVEELACKVVRYNELDPRYKETLDRELKIHPKLDHKNIIMCKKVVKTHRKALLFMEKADDTVSGYMAKSKKPLDKEQAKLWFGELLEALKYLHEKAVAHRDLKTENLLLLDGHIKLADFGFATLFMTREEMKKTLQETKCGTYEYMAPEVDSGKPYDAALADMWSCGVILYEMLTGIVPFPRHLSRTEMRNRQLNREWSFPSDNDRCRLFKLPPISRRAKDLVEKLLDPKPENRPSARRALMHPWLLPRSKMSESIDTT